MSADEVADDRAAEEFCQMCPDVYTHIPTTPTR
jgi:hypothetical protein